MAATTAIAVIEHVAGARATAHLRSSGAITVVQDDNAVHVATVTPAAVRDSITPLHALRVYMTARWRGLVTVMPTARPLGDQPESTP